jgi:hypothetical protein
LNFNEDVASYIHKKVWIIKVIIFIAANLICFSVIITNMLMKVIFYVALSLSMLFLMMAFFSNIDQAHSWKVAWIRQAQTKMNKPTYYICTRLFAMHLVTSLLYSISLDFTVAFFLFNKINECNSTVLLAVVPVCICLLCFAISHVPLLRSNESACQIIFSTLLLNVVYVTWLAVSDPNNESCNMHGTIFSGSIQEASISFKSIASLLYMFVTILSMVLRNDSETSYTWTLLSRNTDTTIFAYTKLHLMFASGSAFTLMAITNFYEPVHNTILPIYSDSDHILLLGKVWSFS